MGACVNSKILSALIHLRRWGPCLSMDGICGNVTRIIFPTSDDVNLHTHTFKNVSIRLNKAWACQGFYPDHLDPIGDWSRFANKWEGDVAQARLQLLDYLIYIFENTEDEQ
jgi:hypothetical protein